MLDLIYQISHAKPSRQKRRQHQSYLLSLFADRKVMKHLILQIVHNEGVETFRQDLVWCSSIQSTSSALTCDWWKQVIGRTARIVSTLGTTVRSVYCKAEWCVPGLAPCPNRGTVENGNVENDSSLIETSTGAWSDRILSIYLFFPLEGYLSELKFIALDLKDHFLYNLSRTDPIRQS